MIRGRECYVEGIVVFFCRKRGGSRRIMGREYLFGRDRGLGWKIREKVVGGLVSEF